MIDRRQWMCEAATAGAVLSANTARAATRESAPFLARHALPLGVQLYALGPVALLRAHPHRFTQMHVKDVKASTIANVAVKQDPTEVGSGKMDWPAIPPAAYAAGLRGFLIEQEPPYTGPRIDSIATSAHYMLGLQAA